MGAGAKRAETQRIRQEEGEEKQVKVVSAET